MDTTAQAVLPRVAIGFNLPFALALRISEDASGLCRPIWIIDSSLGGVEHHRRLLRRLGDVVDVAGLSRRDAAAALRAAAPDHLVTFVDHHMIFLAELAEELGLSFHSPEVAARLEDKLDQRRALARGGLPGPAFVAFSSDAGDDELRAAAAQICFPAVVKPRKGVGSRLAMPLEHPEDLLAAYAGLDLSSYADTADGMILEELIASAPRPPSPFADFVSVESIVQHGVPQHVTVTGRRRLAPPLREAGLFTPSALSAEETEAVKAAASEAITALGVLDSALHIEVKLSPDGPRIIEINGRVGGTVPEILDNAGAGISMTEVALRVAMGEEVRLALPEPLPAVGYKLFWPPPIGATRVVSVDGLDRVSKLPGVTEIFVNRGPGETVDWRNGFAELVFWVCGRARDHDELAELAEWVDAEVVVDYEFDADTRAK